jgi:hypothetical protein
MARSAATPTVWREPQDAAEAVALAVAWGMVLNDWERKFAIGIANNAARLSDKQTDVLVQIILKIERVARMKGLKR